MAVYLCQDPLLRGAEAFCPLPKSHDANNLALSLPFIWAHYPDLSVTGFVTLSSPIRHFLLKLLCCTTSYTLPQREIEMDITDTKEINVMEGVYLEALN